MQMLTLLALFILSGVLIVYIDFIYFLSTLNSFCNMFFCIYNDCICFLVSPILFFIFLSNDVAYNASGQDFTLWSSGKIMVYTIYALVSIGYCCNRYLKKILPPIPHILSVVAMLIGLIFNLIMGIKVGFVSMFGNIPILILLIRQLYFDHEKTLQHYGIVMPDKKNEVNNIIQLILTGNVWKKYLLLLIFCIPFWAVVTGFLSLFGQQPDAILKLIFN